MRFLASAIGILLAAFAHGQIPSDCSQVLVSIAPDWNSDSGRMQLFQKQGGQWVASSSAFPVLFGKNGLAWGRGVAGQNEPGLHKQEKDKRAPAGIFRIGKIYTEDAALPSGANYPFHQITKVDAWIDDPSLPEYNRHVVIDPANPPAWFAKQRMRLEDPAYRWLVEIRHNADPPLPGAGSAIFFHIRRGETRPTAGCTTMSEQNLQNVVTWLRADAKPCYVLLPRSEYPAKMKKWRLPDEPAVKALLGN